MQEQPQIKIGDEQPPERGPFPFALSLALAAAIIIVAGFYFWPGRQSPSQGAPPNVRLSFGPAEQAYAPKIHIENVTLSRAENFLHQEVTTLAGELVNTGDRPVRAVALTVEFSDELNQIALRETRMALAPGVTPLVPAERRAFEISFEHIPASWNMQQPTLRVSGLEFTANR